MTKNGSCSRCIVPPTVNFRERDPECDVDVVTNEARRVPISCGVSTSLAFGGNDAALVKALLDARVAADTHAPGEQTPLLVALGAARPVVAQMLPAWRRIYPYQ